MPPTCTYLDLIREKAQLKSTITFVRNGHWTTHDWPNIIKRSKFMAAWLISKGFAKKKFAIVGGINSLCITTVVNFYLSPYSLYVIGYNL